MERVEHPAKARGESNHLAQAEVTGSKLQLPERNESCIDTASLAFARLGYGDLSQG